MGNLILVFIDKKHVQKNKVALGIEPRLWESESQVMPLHYTTFSEIPWILVYYNTQIELMVKNSHFRITNL